MVPLRPAIAVNEKFTYYYFYYQLNLHICKKYKVRYCSPLNIHVKSLIKTESRLSQYSLIECALSFFRFCIGLMVGSFLVVSFTYTMEFIGTRWRPIIAAIPFWPVGSALLSLTCWLRPNWSDLHIILAAIQVPFLFGYLLVYPFSIYCRENCVYCILYMSCV